MSGQDSRPGHFTPSEMDLGTHWIGGWVGLGAGLDVGAKRRFLCGYGQKLNSLDNFQTGPPVPNFIRILLVVEEMRDSYGRTLVVQYAFS
jgi:hypothetical protein